MDRKQFLIGLGATGLALAEAGPTAAPTATMLMTSAPIMATRVRVKCDCDDIEILLFSPAFFLRADEQG